MDPNQVPIRPDGPWWALAGGAAVGLALAIARAYFYIRRRLNTVRGEEKKAEADERELSRRAAADEAWQLNARLMDIIKGHEEKYDSLTKKYEASVASLKSDHAAEKKECEEGRRKCEIEQAEMCGRLTVIEAWARKKGMPLDKDEMVSQEGSGNHTQIPGGG